MKGRIEILFILEATTGGTFKHVLLLARHLPKERYNVSIALSHYRNCDSREYARQLELEGIKVYDIPMKREISVFSDLKAFGEIVKLLKQGSFDIVHTHSSKAGFLGRMAAAFFNVKVVHTPHCFAFQEKKGAARYAFLLLERFATLFCKRIIAVSKGEYNLILHEHIAPAEKIDLIINAIDENEIVINDASAALKKKFDISPQDSVILGVGRLVKQKNWITFIEIAAEILSREEHVSFLIAGSGESEGLQALIDKLGLGHKIKLTGYVKEIYAMYSLADIFVTTSLWEGLPYVILEAMMMSVPVLATNIPGNQDLITDGENGFLFEPDNRNDAVAILRKLLGDAYYRRQIGKRGYEYIKANNSFDKFLDNHMSLYQSLLSN